MNILSKLIFGLFLVSMPILASAMQTDTWQMNQAELENGWKFTDGIRIEIMKDGVRFIAGKKGGSILKNVNNRFLFDVISFEYDAPKTNDIKIAWHNLGDKGKDMFIAQTAFIQTDGWEVANFNMEKYDVWSHLPDVIGLYMPPESEISIKQIELKRWNFFEKSVEFIKGFWTFDSFRPYSINFLWGPRISFNPVAREHIFDSQPPAESSANGIFYAAFIIGCLIIFMIAKHKKLPKIQITRIILLLIVCMWVIYDLRMGAEFIHYVKNDYDTYYSKEIGVRTFRERLFFNDFADDIAKVVAEKDKYIFLAPSGWPYIGIMKYVTYPSIPVDPFNGNAHLYETWIVYGRPDIQIVNNQLSSSDGAFLSPPGNIVHEYEKGTFIFLSNL